MADQAIGDDGGYIRIIIGGAPDWEYYTQIRKVKTGLTTVKPGLFVSGNGEAEGEVDLAAVGDEDTSFVELVLEIVGEAPGDIDTTAAALDYVKTLRYSGGRFKVVTIRADESTSIAQGQLLCLDAGEAGHAGTWAYTDTAEATDVIFFPAFRAAASSADVADTGPVIQAWW